MITIYHNPRCSKSRQTLALIEEKGLEVTVIEYLKNPPSASELDEIIKKLNIGPRELLRTGEAEFNEAQLSDLSLDDKEIIIRMTQYPKLIERPIVVNGAKAIIGRPPEAVLEII